nr:hypothetical protein [Candidatus Mycoplasma haematolamae]
MNRTNNLENLKFKLRSGRYSSLSFVNCLQKIAVTGLEAGKSFIHTINWFITEVI